MIDLYKFYTVSSELSRYDERVDFMPEYALQQAYSMGYSKFNKEYPKGEQCIAKDAQCSLTYAIRVIQGPFKLGEDAIASNNTFASIYATDIIKGRWIPGEKAILASISCNSYKLFLRSIGQYPQEGF